MTSSNGSIFRVTGPLCEEFTGLRWFPRTKASDAELWCFLWSAPWINDWVNNREAGDLRRRRAHYDAIVMNIKIFNMAENTIMYLSTTRVDKLKGCRYTELATIPIICDIINRYVCYHSKAKHPMCSTFIIVWQSWITHNSVTRLQLKLPSKCMRYCEVVSDAKLMPLIHTAE